jgi:uncharacterized protein
MNLNNTDKHPFLLFLNALMIGLFVTAVCSMVLMIPHYEEIKSQIYDPLASPRCELIIMQFVSMIGLFILPPVMFAIFVKQDFIKVFNLDKKVEFKKYVYATLLAVVLFPILINIQYVITLLPLPESMRASAEAQKLLGEKIFGIFLDFPGLPNFMLMILMIGVGAGLTEELFFRGFLLKILENHIKAVVYGVFVFLAMIFLYKFSFIYLAMCILIAIGFGFLYHKSGKKSRQWLAIILSSFIFSAFHASIYNFLPIMMVGVLLSFIYTKTNDLKLNIFLHALYNSLQVILNYMFINKMINFDIDKMEFVPVYIWAICAVLAVLLIKLIIKSNENISSQS